MSKSKMKRNRYEAKEKVSVLERHLLKKELVSDICEGMGIGPNQYYRWQKELFDNGEAAFQKNGDKKNSKIRKLEHEIEELKARLVHKNSVIAELTEDYVKLKKNSGEI
jgi:transposase-like protein